MSQLSPSYESGIFIPHEALDSMPSEHRQQLVLILGNLGMETDLPEQLRQTEMDTRPILVTREEFIGAHSNVSADKSLGVKVWNQLYKTWRVNEEVAYKLSRNEFVQEGLLNFTHLTKDVDVRFEPVYVPLDQADAPLFELPEEYMAIDVNSVKRSLTDGSIQMLRNMGSKRIDFLSTVVDSIAAADAKD